LFLTTVSHSCHFTNTNARSAVISSRKFRSILTGWSRSVPTAAAESSRRSPRPPCSSKGQDGMSPTMPRNPARRRHLQIAAAKIPRRKTSLSRTAGLRKAPPKRVHRKKVHRKKAPPRKVLLRRLPPGKAPRKKVLPGNPTSGNSAKNRRPALDGRVSSTSLRTGRDLALRHLPGNGLISTPAQSDLRSW